MDKITAYEAVQDFIDRAHRAGARHVLIITGKGRSSEGILRAQLPHWLNEPGLRRMVVGIAQASPNRGGSGVFHVVLKRA
jgi:DNA-nicking Smr family endonuclease